MSENVVKGGYVDLGTIPNGCPGVGCASGGRHWRTLMHADNGTYRWKCASCGWTDKTDHPLVPSRFAKDDRQTP